MNIDEHTKKLIAGFTLVELLIVMAIIALLAMLGGANYLASIRRSRDSRRIADLEQVRSALEMYRTDTGGYFVADVCNAGDLPTNYTALMNELTPPTNNYLNQDILDPQTDQAYFYCSDGLTYQLCANLEAPIGAPSCTLADGDHGVMQP